MKPPQKEDDWKQIAEEFEEWNFIHYLGAINGKHICIDCPKYNKNIIIITIKEFILHSFHEEIVNCTLQQYKE